MDSSGLYREDYVADLALWFVKPTDFVVARGLTEYCIVSTSLAKKGEQIMNFTQLWFCSLTNRWVPQIQEPYGVTEIPRASLWSWCLGNYQGQIFGWSKLHSFTEIKEGRLVYASWDSRSCLQATIPVSILAIYFSPWNQYVFHGGIKIPLH